MLMLSIVPPAALAQVPSWLAAKADVTSVTTPGPPEPSYLEPLNPDESTPILGRTVVGPDGGKLGLITDVIVDGHGQPRAAVIDFGGFLGVGSRKIAVDWNLLAFEPGHKHKVMLALDRHEIESAPEYKADAASAQMVGPPLIGPSGTAVEPPGD
jgi:hypothetical protein